MSLVFPYRCDRAASHYYVNLLTLAVITRVFALEIVI